MLVFLFSLTLEVIDIHGLTHLSAGVFLGAVTGLSLGNSPQNLAACIAVGGVMAVLSDIDHPGSLIGRVFRSLSVKLEERWGHRDSPTHTAAFIFLLSVPVLVAGFLPGHPAGPGVTAVFAGASHLWMDSKTRSGVRPWRYLPVPEKWRNKVYRGKLESGKSALEWGLACACFLGATALSLAGFIKIY